MGKPAFQLYIYGEFKYAPVKPQQSFSDTQANLLITSFRYSTYMKIFTPFRRQSISRATMSVYSIVLHNCPLFTNHSASIFFKFYSYSPLRHIYTTDVQ